VNSQSLNDSMNWRRLCRALAVEQDADKMRQLIEQINSNVDNRQRDLRLMAGSGPRLLQHRTHTARRMA